jgi:hypothetical protein
VSLPRERAADLRGAARAAIDATTGLVEVVEHMHLTVQRLPLPLSRVPVAGRTRGITGLVYRSIRGTTRLVGWGLEAALGAGTALLPASAGPTPSAPRHPRRDALVAVLNGTHGDHLARSGNPLAIPMALRHQGRAIDPLQPAALLQQAGAPVTGRLLVLLHGLCMNDRQWRVNRGDGQSHDHGQALAAALGMTPLYLHYNSGLAIADNGRAFAALLDTVCRHWPVPLTEIVLLGHSMGGLVARSACHVAHQQQLPWLPRLSKLVFLGTPHQGAPLERGGHGVDRLLALSPYAAPLGRIGRSRSAGIQDLRHGRFTDEPTAHGVPLPAGVACFAAAATLAKRHSPLAERIVGDGLVPLHSALGRHPDPARALGLPPSRQWTGCDMGHLELLWRPQVLAQLMRWLAPTPGLPSSRPAASQPG